MGGVEGVKEYAFELKWSKYVQKYKVKVNYSCAKIVWRPIPWKANPEHEYLIGGQEYQMVVPNKREGEWGKICPMADL